MIPTALLRNRATFSRAERTGSGQTIATAYAEDVPVLFTGRRRLVRNRTGEVTVADQTILARPLPDGADVQIGDEVTSGELPRALTVLSASKIGAPHRTEGWEVLAG